VRSRGWQGSRPADDDEARERIIDAAMRCIDRYGAEKTGLSDVAAELGVTRQTVYRLFASTEELFTAVGQASADSFLDQLAARFAHITDPADVLIEMMAYTLERLPKDRYMGLLLTTGHQATFARGVTSSVAFRFARSMLDRVDVDWAELGFTKRDLNEMCEFFLRLLQSFALNPGRQRSRAELRAFLYRWVAPAVRAHATAQP
jgi:AcrR family transcriptional regulator